MKNLKIMNKLNIALGSIALLLGFIVVPASAAHGNGIMKGVSGARMMTGQKAMLVGKVRSISGSSLVVSGKSGSYNVNISNAIIFKANVKASITDIAIGDTLYVQGMPVGRNINATRVEDKSLVASVTKINTKTNNVTNNVQASSVNTNDQTINPVVPQTVTPTPTQTVTANPVTNVTDPVAQAMISNRVFRGMAGLLQAAGIPLNQPIVRRR